MESTRVEERGKDEPPVQDGIGSPVRVGGADAARCPFCHDAVDVEAPTWVACAGCLARHHGGCWGEGARCAACGHGERLLRPTAGPAPAGEATDRSPPAGALLGEPRKLALERVLPGEAGPEAEADLLRLLLDRYGTVGTLVRAGGLLTWSPQTVPGQPARLLRVTVDADGGATRVRADEDLNPLVGGWFAGLTLLAVLVGAFAGAVISDELASSSGAPLALTPVLLFVAALLVARAAVRAKVRERRAELRALVDDLAARISRNMPAGHAARAAKKPDPGAPHA